MQHKISVISRILMHGLPLIMGACILLNVDNLRAAITPMAGLLAISAGYQLYLLKTGLAKKSEMRS